MDLSTNYTWPQLGCIAICALFLVAAMFLFQKRSYKLSVVMLFISALVSRYLAASLDPFLHLFDEQFHALVAKNLLKDMLTPVLFEKQYFQYDIANWAGNSIWLHKQPWFMWQMALSMKIFGFNEIAIRIPSVIMSALMVPLVYRMGRLVATKRTGWYAAFLMAVCFYQIEYASGNAATDHNDISFMFYVTCSFWAFFEYIRNPKLKWAVLAGAFAGIAVLNKWLVGLSVFAAWFIYLITQKDVRSQMRYWYMFGLAVVAAVIVFLPWQIYIFKMFPKEAAHEFEFTSRHFSEAVEGHGGNAWYHLEKIPELYGKLAPFLILPGIIAFVRRSKKQYTLAFISTPVIVYLFYTVAVTKMMLFTFCMASFFFIFFGAFVEEADIALRRYFSKKNAAICWFVSLIVVGAICMNTDELDRRHSSRFDGPYYERRIAGSTAVKKAALLLKDKEYAVFNADPFLLPEFCFYTGQRGYPYFPTEEQCVELHKKGINIAIFWNKTLPQFILRDRSVLVLPKNFFWVFEN